MKYLLIIISVALLCGCYKEKLMVVTFTKSRVSTQMVMPYDKTFKKSLKDSTYITVKIIRRKKSTNY